MHGEGKDWLGYVSHTLTNCFASTITLEPLCLHAGNDVLPRLLP